MPYESFDQSSASQQDVRAHINAIVEVYSPRVIVPQGNDQDLDRTNYPNTGYNANTDWRRGGYRNYGRDYDGGGSFNYDSYTTYGPNGAYTVDRVYGGNGRDNWDPRQYYRGDPGIYARGYNDYIDPGIYYRGGGRDYIDPGIYYNPGNYRGQFDWDYDQPYSVNGSYRGRQRNQYGDFNSNYRYPMPYDDCDQYGRPIRPPYRNPRYDDNYDCDPYYRTPPIRRPYDDCDQYGRPYRDPYSRYDDRYRYQDPRYNDQYSRYDDRYRYQQDPYYRYNDQYSRYNDQYSRYNDRYRYQDPRYNDQYSRYDDRYRYNDQMYRGNRPYDWQRMSYTIRSMEGHSVREYNPNVSEELGCATFVSEAVSRATGRRITATGCNDLKQQLVRNGYREISPSQAQPGDCIVADRGPGEHGHAAIYVGNGKVANNSSREGRITIDNASKFNSPQFVRVHAYTLA